MSVFIAGAASALLGGCGFHPLYGKANREVAAQEAAIKIVVLTAGDQHDANYRINQQLRNMLATQLTPGGDPAQPRYNLQIKLSESKENLAIEKNQVATRATLLITATYRLYFVDNSSIIYSSSARGIASYDIAQSEYSNLVAEQDAERRSLQGVADQVTLEISFHFTQKNPTEPVGETERPVLLPSQPGLPPDTLPSGEPAPSGPGQY